MLDRDQSIRIDLEEGVDRQMVVELLFAQGPIKVVVTQVKGRQVKLGIRADQRLAIVREELLDGRG
jgi:sRNA-binding carbon storage regulator CsrA